MCLFLMMGTVLHACWAKPFSKSFMRVVLYLLPLPFIFVSICGGDIGEVTHTPHFCKIKSTNVPECTQCTMEVTRYTAKAKFKSTSELLRT